jgi:mannose-6-phosphate isomerase-like protein (cupin superfamily)
MGYTIRSIDELESIHHGAVRLAGDELGIESFGMQVFDFPGGFRDYPEHDHAADGQEEVYVVLKGDAEFVVDGEGFTVAPGQLLKVDAPSRRRLEPGPEGVRILAIGCSPGAAYERPDDFRSRARA